MSDPRASFETGPVDYGTVEDGFGGEWLRCKATCGLEVVRPGKVQCWCDDPEGHVRAAAAEVFKPEGVAIWYDAPNLSLHNATPRQYVEAGDADKVLDVLDRLIGGAFG